MALVKGMGACLVPRANGIPCARQINEGEPVGSVLLGLQGSVVGHKKCVDDYYQRKQKEQQKAVHESMVKRVDQAGPGGFTDMSKGRDAIIGSIPLEKPEAEETAPEPASGLGGLAAAIGARPITDVPFEDAPPDVDPAQYSRVRTEERRGEAGVHLTDSEKAEMEAFRQKLIDQRHPVGQVGHAIGEAIIDLAEIPPGMTRLRILIQATNE